MGGYTTAEGNPAVGPSVDVAGVVAVNAGHGYTGKTY